MGCVVPSMFTGHGTPCPYGIPRHDRAGLFGGFGGEGFDDGDVLQQIFR
jgi:hypothetical protein